VQHFAAQTIVNRLSQLIGGVMQQTNLASQANLTRDVALLLGGEAGVAARKNLSTLIDEATQLRRALVVETGDEFRVKRLALGTRGTNGTTWSGHQCHVKSNS